MHFLSIQLALSWQSVSLSHSAVGARASKKGVTEKVSENKFFLNFHLQKPKLLDLPLLVFCAFFFSRVRHAILRLLKRGAQYHDIAEDQRREIREFISRVRLDLLD